MATEGSSVSAVANFGHFGRSFQEKVVQALLVDKQFAEQMLEVINVSYFDLRYLQFLAQRYFEHSKKYRVFPSLQLLVSIVRDELKVGTDVALCEQVVEYLQRIRSNPDSDDLPYVKDRSLEFCRKQALKAALTQAVDDMEVGRYEQIVEGIKKAVCVGTTPSLGHDFINDIESRFTLLQRNCVPTGMTEVDAKDVLNGGLGSGELGVIIAPTGVGKSHFLTFLGASAMRLGVNVLHYTFELSEAAIGLRYDSNLCDIDSNTVIENKEKVIDAYGKMKLGRLMIKGFPSNSASVYTLRAHMERLDLKGFRPGLLLVDYADIMKSTRQYDSLRHELKLIYEELRAMLQELGIPGWTASQSNREGSSQDVVDLSNMSESYGKAFVADAVVSLSRRTHEKSSGDGRLGMVKNRFGRDGLVWPVSIDTARSRFSVSGGQLSFQQASADVEREDRVRLKEKLAELRRDNLLKAPDQPATG